MANMSYVRFENTYNDLQDCYEAIVNEEELSESEEDYKQKLIKLCKKIISEVNDERTISGSERKNNANYSVELPIIRDLSIQHFGKNITNEGFNEIFEVAIKRNSSLTTLATGIQDNVYALLTKLGEAALELKNAKNEKFVVVKTEKNGEEVPYTKPLEKKMAQETAQFFQKKFGGQFIVKEYQFVVPRYEKGEKFVNDEGRTVEITEVKEREGSEKKYQEIHATRYDSKGKFFGNFLEDAENFTHKLENNSYRKQRKGNTNASSEQQGLKEEAIELAKKLGDDTLVEYLKKAPLKAITARIDALRGEASYIRTEVEKPAERLGLDNDFHKMFLSDKGFRILYDSASTNLMSWNKAKKIKVDWEELKNFLDQMPVVDMKKYGKGFTPNDDLPKELQGKMFILKNGGKIYFVDTQGHKYSRYVAELLNYKV